MKNSPKIFVSLYDKLNRGWIDADEYTQGCTSNALWLKYADRKPSLPPHRYWNGKYWVTSDDRYYWDGQQWHPAW